MFGLIKKVFIGLLTGLIIGSNNTRWVSLSNQKCMTQFTLINLHPNEYSQEFHYSPFSVKLDRCVGSFDTINNLANQVCVPNKIEDLILSVFNMITGINVLKTLTKRIHANVNVDLMEENVIQVNGGIMTNVDVSLKKVMYVKKIMFGILLHVIVKMENI